MRIPRFDTNGGIGAWISAGDSLLNKATGTNESFNELEVGSSESSLSTDKDGNLLLAIVNSAQTTLYKIFSDKSFIRLFVWGL